MSEQDQSTTGNTQPLDASAVSDDTRSAPLAVGTVLKDDYRVSALLTDTPTLRVYRVVMLSPGDQCPKCGAALQADDQFCEECGAQVEEQTALLQETSAAEPSGAALLADIHVDDPAAAATLPTVREVFVTDDYRYAVLNDTSSALMRFDAVLSEAGAALDETDTMQIGVAVAQALALLHRNGLALGRLTLADLALTPQRHVVLADGSAIRRSQGDEDQEDDVYQLALVLEKLAGISRETRRLDETNQPLPLENFLANVISDVRNGTINDAQVLAQTLNTILEQQATPGSLRTRTGYATDTGRIRDHNEDSLLAWDLRLMWDNQLTNVGLYIVADGMGGHEGGEVASGIAIHTIAQVLVPALIDPLLHTGPLDTAALTERVQQAVLQSNAAIYEESVERGNDMGTTLTLAVVVGDRAIVGNVGDSRTYLYRGDTLQRVTKDHSLVQRLVDIGQIDADDVYTHPNRNAILRSLGDGGELDVDVFEVQLSAGDMLLLCSDGLWEMVRDPKIKEIITGHAAPPDACEELIRAANAGGGEDNISAVLVRFSDPHPADLNQQA